MEGDEGLRFRRGCFILRASRGGEGRMGVHLYVGPTAQTIVTAPSSRVFHAMYATEP